MMIVEFNAENYGDTIRRLRLNKKMTQADLAKQVHVSVVSIGTYERSETVPNMRMLMDIYKALGVDEVRIYL